MDSMTLPQVQLGNLTVSRLMVGGNPFAGNSHLSVELSNDMLDYYTVANIKNDLRECERCGITTAQLRADMHIRRLLKEYWDEGGAIKWLAQTAPEIGDFPTYVQQIKAWGASAVYLHGGVTDEHYQMGRLGVMRERLKMMRDLGVAIGLGAHDPEVIEEVESQGWDLDFYACCFYNLSRTPRESFVATGRAHEEQFLQDDPERMCRTIRQVSKPVVAFKILGAGRRCGSAEEVRRAFEFAYSNIKPIDTVTVGVFSKHANQIQENARIAREILAAE
ncbi:MAG: hypothetical protein Q7N50_01330 [Armatimonadota bacterium]|nr:hypothetical protein [Armatimonadota bacterium]